MRRLLASLVGLAIAGVPAASKATAIDLNQLYEFGFSGAGALENGAGTIAVTNPPALQVGDAPWTFTLATAGTLIVQDLFLSVDQFQFSDFGSVIGTTSAPTPGTDCGSDVGCAAANSNFSHGEFILAAGDHSITGIQITGQPGAAVFEVAVGVPGPVVGAGLPGLLAGFGAMLAWYRKRRVAV